MRLSTQEATIRREGLRVRLSRSCATPDLMDVPMTAAAREEATRRGVSDLPNILAKALVAAARDGRLVSLSQARDADGHDVLTIVMRPAAPTD